MKQKGKKKAAIFICILLAAAIVAGITLFALAKSFTGEEELRYSADSANVVTLSTEKPDSVYDLAYQEKVGQEIAALEAQNTYTVDNPLVILNPYGTNTLSVYVHFTTQTPVSVSYRMWTTDATIPAFARTLYNGGEDNLSTEHSYQMIGLIPDCVNTVELTLTDESGEQVGMTAFEVTAPALSSGVEVQLDKQTASEQTALSDGLFVSLGADGSSAAYSYALLYDNDGFIRGEIPLDDYRPDRLNFDGESLIIPAAEDQIVWIDRTGRVEQVVSIDGYSMHHDLITQEDGSLLVLASKESKDTEEDIILEVNKDGSVTELLDLETLFPEYVEACTTDSDKLDWFHANAITLAGDDSIILSAREPSTLVKIDNLHTDPSVSYLIGDQSIWDGFSYAELLLEKEGDFISQGGQHSVTYQESDALEDGQYYLYLFNNNWGSMETRPSYDWSQIEGINQTSADENAHSMVYKYLVDENAGTYSLVFEIEVPYSNIVSSAQQMDNGNYVVCSGKSKLVLEYDEEGNKIARFTVPAESFMYRMFKYTFANYWFAE